MKSIASHSTVPSSHARNTQKWHNWEKNELKGKEVQKGDALSDTSHDPDHVSFGGNIKSKNHHNYKSYEQRDQSTPTQLFTKLKMQKYQRENQSVKQKDAKYIFSCLKQANEVYQQHSIHIQNLQENKKEQNHSTTKIQLNPYQIQLLQTLKYDKVNYIVRQHIFKGRSVKQILKSDVLVMLEQQILKIVSLNEEKNDDDKILRKILKMPTNYQTVLEKQIMGNYNQSPQNWGSVGSKNLQSTAQYWEKSDQKSIQQNEFDYYKRIQRRPINFVKENNIISNNQSTIKKLKSKNTDDRKIDNLTYQRSLGLGNIEKLDNNLENIIQGVNVVQFTLGECQEENEDSENFTERQCQTNMIENIHTFNISGRFAKAEELTFGVFNKNGVDDELESEKMGRDILIKQQDGDHKVLAFNRRRVPKGRAIKNRVMGNMNLDQNKAQKL